MEFFFEIRRNFFEIWSILWRHYTPLLVENWPNFAGLWKTQFLMKTQMENTKRRKMRSSTRWPSRFFKILGFWPLKFQKSIFWKMIPKIQNIQSKYGSLNFAVLECSLNVWIVNKPYLQRQNCVKSALPKPKFLLHCRKWRNINLSWRNFQTSIYSTLSNIFFGKNFQTWSAEPTEHFGIYFGYIQRLFQSWVSPFNPRTAGGLSHLRTPGGGGRMTAPPENSKTKKDSDKR